MLPVRRWRHRPGDGRIRRHAVGHHCAASAPEAKARGFKAILRRSVTVRVVEDVDEVVLSAAEAKALVAGDPDVLKRVQLQVEIVKLEALRAAHLDQQVQARWQLKRLPQRIADLRARVETIAADVAFRDAHAPQPNAHGDKPFSFAVDGRVYSDRARSHGRMGCAPTKLTSTRCISGLLVMLRSMGLERELRDPSNP